MGESAETRQVRMQNETQMAVNRENIAAQRDENQKDRDFQQAQWQREFNAQTEFQRNFWKEQFDAQNAYNTPTAQVARLQAAGINPAALISQITGVSSGASNPSSSSPSPSIPSGGHGLSGSIPGVVPTSTNAALFSSLAQLNDALANGAKVGLETQRQKKLLDAELENIHADSSSKYSNANLNNINANLQTIFGSQEKAANIMKSINDSYAAYTQGDLNKASELLSGVQSWLGAQDFVQKNQQFPQLMDNLKKLGDFYDAQKKEAVAKANESNASAAKIMSEKKYQDYVNEIKEIENKAFTGALKDEETLKSYVQGVIDRIKSDAAAAGKDKIVNEIEEYQKSRLDPRDKTYSKNRLNDVFNQVRVWLKGIRN